MEMIAYIVTLLVFAGVVVFILIKMLRTVEKVQNFHMRTEASKQLTPIRLRAYERMAIFLERINPNSLLMRQDLGKNVPCITLQQRLISQIRQEWEHNAAQQIYVSENAWNMVSTAKESIIELINTSASDLQQNAIAMGLATTILDNYNSTKQKELTVLDKAMAALKKDIAEFC